MSQAARDQGDSETEWRWEVNNRYRIETGIPKEVRKDYIQRAQTWCEYSLRFGDGAFDQDCLDYRHYVRCIEHEYCDCVGDTLILICERCWKKVLNEIRRKEYEKRDMSDLHEARRSDCRGQIGPTPHFRARPGTRSCRDPGAGGQQNG